MKIHKYKWKGTISSLLVLVLIASVVFCAVDIPVSAASDVNVRIGQATSNENRTTRGGKAGDQTGKEVAFDSWSYNKKSGTYNNWKYMFRAKDPAVAVKIAAAMKDTCENNKIGYDQKWPDRVSFYDKAKAVDWNIRAIDKKCETTCAQAISVCIISAGIELPRYWDCSLVYEDLKNTGEFTIFTDSKHLSSPDLLEPGDILLSPKTHTAMVVDSPNEPGSEAGPEQVALALQELAKLAKEDAARKAAEAAEAKKAAAEAAKQAEEEAAAEEARIKAEAEAAAKQAEAEAAAEEAKKKAEEIKKKAEEAKKIAEEAEAAKKAAEERAAQKAAAAAAAKKKAAEAEKNKTGETTKKKTSNKKTKFKAGKDYTLKKALNVRTGPGTKYKKVLRKNLTKDGKKHAAKGRYGKLKKGTIVTCIKVKGNWMLIPSGWICCKKGNLK